MKDVIRKTLTAGQETVFEMGLMRSQFLVKNFTDGTIYVTLGNNNNSSMIGAKKWERVFNNINNTVEMTAEATNIVKVQSEANGIVEVMSIDF